MNSESTVERMKRLGEIRFRNLIALRGGVHSSDEVAKILNKPTETIVEMAQGRQLIAFRWSESWAYPVAQFENGKVIGGVREVLAAFPDNTDDITVALFFLTSYESTGQTPLALLKAGNYLDALILSAHTMSEHGAR